MQNRVISFVEAIREATDIAMERDDNVYIIGEGVPDPKAIFGTTLGLKEKYGKRVLDMPVAENGMTGIVIGSSLVGMRPILVHQRIDFSTYALEQIINNAAKWYSMYGGQKSVPIVIRCIIGQGWGQGNQHSQNLQSLYAHIPGLKVVMPSSPYEAKGLLLSSIKDNNPVIFIEHRWCHYNSCHVDEGYYEIPLGKARVVTEGQDITVVSWSNWLYETIKATTKLEKSGISSEVIDLRSLRPLDYESIKKSVMKTGRLLVVDGSWKTNGFAGEIIAKVCEDEDVQLLSKPKRITYPDFPSASSPALTKYYYPDYVRIADMITNMCSKKIDFSDNIWISQQEHRDIPDRSFTGPF